MKIDIVALLLITIVSSITCTLLLVYHVYGGRHKMATDIKLANNLLESARQSITLSYDNLKLVGDQTISTLETIRSAGLDFQTRARGAEDSLEMAIQRLESSAGNHIEYKLNNLRVHAGQNPIYIIQPSLVKAWEVSIDKEDVNDKELRDALRAWLLTVKPQGSPKDPEALQTWVSSILTDSSLSVFKRLLATEVSRAKWDTIVALCVRDGQS